MRSLSYVILFCTVCSIVCWNEGYFLGCYSNIPNVRTNIPSYSGQNNCIKACGSRYYRYAIPDTTCSCGNYEGEQVSNTTCNECQDCKDKEGILDIYATGNLLPGPPRNLRISNVTDTSLKISWSEPESFVELTSYKIRAKLLKTFSTFPPMSPEWVYSNKTFQTDIITLHPSSIYNLSITSVSPDGEGAAIYSDVKTEIGEPDNPPSPPELLSNDGSQIKIKMMAVTNNNGPVSAYRIVVVNNDVKESFNKDNLMSYDAAKRMGLTYYTAAELNPIEITKPFIVGDGRSYGGFYNPQLDPNVNYNIILGVVSRMGNETKICYSVPFSDTLVFKFSDEEGENSALIVVLSVAIGLLSCVLVASVIGFIILRNRVTNRRQRLSDNQELTLQGPMIEVENNGYIPEEEHVPINHYRSLRQKLQTFLPSQIKIDTSNLLGTGKFGRVNRANILNGDNLTPIAAYTIQDKKMGQETRKSMLQELDLLIKTGKHDNIIQLLGTCETPQTVIVALELVTTNLKEFLLGSRETLPERFSSLSEYQALDTAMQIAQGMAHLEHSKILHKQLCARSILLSNGVPKISGYGLAQYHSHNKIPDYTRWTAIEVFRGQPHNPKSDVWSFACLLWEICALGGTPYASVSNTNEIPEKIMRGLRLPQLQYFSEDLYQVMLDCWQIDTDERPKFEQLLEMLMALQENTFVPYLSFNLMANFQYEPFYPDIELAVRPNY
ncbi:unnamed protein product [Brassicogethes aeneus]|uniref:Tyrosine-protein kinase Wsck n=1 Tax=Brassicogethes aeneus TaxID=1431903 RepID=A0A9P0BEC8_BRAAE|nr:unnamed protein product [Brassicogethes aeneus]